MSRVPSARARVTFIVRSVRSAAAREKCRNGELTKSMSVSTRTSNARCVRARVTFIVRSVRSAAARERCRNGELCAAAFDGGVQRSGAVIFLPVFGQPFATRRRTRLEGDLAVLGESRGGGPVWDVESGGTVCVLVADCQWPQSRARLKPETMIVTFEEFRPAHDFFDYTRYYKEQRACRTDNKEQIAHS